MTLPRLEALSKYWKDFPPAHIAIGGSSGKSSSQQQDQGDFDALWASVPMKEMTPHVG